jgi:hypothetical protein
LSRFTILFSNVWSATSDYPGSRIRDDYPGSRILIFTHPGYRISETKTATKEKEEKKFVAIPWDPGYGKKPIPNPDPQHCPQHCNPTPLSPLSIYTTYQKSIKRTVFKILNLNFSFYPLRTKNTNKRKNFSKAAKRPY